jgi:hypothetical protein
MRVEWLTERCTTTDAREIRRQGMASLDLTDKHKQELLDRGEERFQEWVRTRWEPFIAHRQPGDELWRFHSPPPSWANKMGCSGYAIVRDGAIVEAFVTVMN